MESVSLSCCCAKHFSSRILARQKRIKRNKKSIVNILYDNIWGVLLCLSTFCQATLQSILASATSHSGSPSSGCKMITIRSGIQLKLILFGKTLNFLRSSNPSRLLGPERLCLPPLTIAFYVKVYNFPQQLREAST